MERISLSYKLLFSIEIWHDFFLKLWGKEWEPTKLLNQIPPNYTLTDYLFIDTDQKTKEVMKNLGLKFVRTPKGLAIYVEAIPANLSEFQTSTNLEEEIKFTFQLFLNQNKFLNFSSIPFNVPDPNILYVSNLVNNLTTDGAYLSQPINAYSNSVNYDIGDLVKNTTGNKLYESIADRSIRGDLRNTNKWVEFEYYNDSTDVLAKEIQTITSKDTVLEVGQTFYYKTQNNNPGSTISFTLRDIENNLVELGNIPGTSINQGEIIAPIDPLIPVKHQIALHKIPNGYYSLQITHESHPILFYLNNGRNKPLGVIEIFGNTPHVDYKFFENRVVSGNQVSILNRKRIKSDLKIDPQPGNISIKIIILEYPIRHISNHLAVLLFKFLKKNFTQS